MDKSKPSRAQLDAWSRDPKNWKWGLFYYNKEDKRLMPPKRNPAMGYTINFANKYSVLLFMLLLLIPVLISLLLMQAN